MKVSCVSFYKTDKQNNIFKQPSSYYHQPFAFLKDYLLQNGYELNTQDITPINHADLIIFFRLEFKILLQMILAKKYTKSIYIPFEPPVITPVHSQQKIKKIANLFSKILTWNDDLVDNQKFFKYYWPMHDILNNYEQIPFIQKKLITNISGYKFSSDPHELYSKRIEAIRYFEKHVPNEFDLFGVGWDKNLFPSYRGKIEDKYQVLQQYKFSICYENMCGINGYITEKIFDCFYAGCVPIYWGTDNIDKYIPKLCYIDKRNFSNYSDLHTYLKNMTESEYNIRINAIKEYLQSESFKQHLPQHFASTILNNLQTIKEIKVSPRNLVCSLLYFVVYDLAHKLNGKLNKIRTIF